MVASYVELNTGEETGPPSDGRMPLLEHLDEVRRRLIRSVAFVCLALVACWFVSSYIYGFLARPVRQALADAGQQQLPVSGRTGQEKILPLSLSKEGEAGRYVFAQAARFGACVVPAGASVRATVGRDAEGRIGLFTDEPLYSGASVVPEGVRLPFDPGAVAGAAAAGAEDKLIVTTALEPFSLYLKVSLYAAVCLSIPFLLWQLWGFLAPALYPHERSYALPFVALSSVSFVAGAIFAYYVIFPPAATYLLGLGQDFRLLLKADDYFDFIILVMLGMGLVFQMPAITYVLSRIGLVSARFLLRVWKSSLMVILVAAAVLSPTNDIPNMLLFAAPMVVLYIISIFVAWAFGRERTAQ